MFKEESLLDWFRHRPLLGKIGFTILILLIVVALYSGLVLENYIASILSLGIVFSMLLFLSKMSDR